MKRSSGGRQQVIGCTVGGDIVQSGPGDQVVAGVTAGGSIIQDGGGQGAPAVRSLPATAGYHDGYHGLPCNPVYDTALDDQEYRQGWQDGDRDRAGR